MVSLSTSRQMALDFKPIQVQQLTKSFSVCASHPGNAFLCHHEHGNSQGLCQRLTSLPVRPPPPSPPCSPPPCNTNLVITHSAVLASAAALG